MISKFRWKSALILASVLLVACGPEVKESWTTPQSVTGPIQLEDRVVYLERGSEQLFSLQSVRGSDRMSLEVERFKTGSNPGVIGRSADRNSIYLVNEGDESLQVVDFSSGAPVSSEITVRSPYDRLDVDPHGEFLLMRFSGVLTGQVVARNLNELAIVDLRGNEPQAVFVTLPGRPLHVFYAAPFSLGGQERRLAAVLTANDILVVDLDGADDRAVQRVPLTISQAEAQRRPEIAIFDVVPREERPDEVRLFVLSRQSSDITEVDIRLSNDEARPFRLSVNQHVGGNTPSRMVLLDIPEVGPRLIVLDAVQPRFTVVDILSATSATFSLESSRPGSGMLVFTAVVEEPDGSVYEEERILVWSTDSEIASVIRPSIISLGGEQPTLGRSVESILLPARPTRVEIPEGQAQQAIAFHAGSSSGFSLINLRRHFAVPIQGGGIRDLHYDGQLAWVVYQSLPNLTVVGEDGHPQSFELPEPGARLMLDDRTDALIVQHEGALGRFTVLDATAPTPARATVYENLFLDGFIGWEMP